MCLVGIKPKDKPYDEERLMHFIETTIDNNRSGFGFALKRHNSNSVIMKKGIWTKEKALEIIKELKIQDKDEFIWHGRVSTHGVRSESNAHPYIIGELSDQKGGLTIDIEFDDKHETFKGVFMHNGVFNKHTNWHDKDLSDTYNYGAKVFANELIIDSIKQDSETFEIAWRDKRPGWAKVAFLFPDVGIRLICDTPNGWVTDAETGYIFSHSGYKTRGWVDKGGVRVDNKKETLIGLTIESGEIEEIKPIALLPPKSTTKTTTVVKEQGIVKTKINININLLKELSNITFEAINTIYQGRVSLTNYASTYSTTKKIYCDRLLIEKGDLVQISNVSTHCLDLRIISKSRGIVTYMGNVRFYSADVDSVNYKCDILDLFDNCLYARIDTTNQPLNESEIALLDYNKLQSYYYTTKTKIQKQILNKLTNMMSLTHFFNHYKNSMDKVYICKKVQHISLLGAYLFVINNQELFTKNISKEFIRKTQSLLFKESLETQNYD
jgi:hypothetical protein